MQPNVSATSELRPRHVAAIALGNVLEFYDFLIFSFYAIQIGRQFFPADRPELSLVNALAVFGAGFLTRPLGGLVIGRYADRHGRRPAMMWSFSLMGVSIIGMACMPTYHQIGLAAPILVVALRLLQGFAIGGETGPALATLAEGAKPHRRGLILSYQQASQQAALVMAGLVAALLAWSLGPVDFDAYGWRASFLLGAIVFPVGLWIRRSLPETMHGGPDTSATSEPVLPIRRIVVLASILILCGTVQAFIQIYLSTYAIAVLHMEKGVAYTAALVAAGSGAVASLCAGAWSDRIGARRPFLIGTFIFRALAAFPMFWLLVHFRTPACLYAVAICLGIQGCTSLNFVVVIEALPRRVRAGLYGTIYAITGAIFGGSTQLAIQSLIELTNNPLMPAAYLVVFSVFGSVAACMFPETAPRPREGRG